MRISESIIVTAPIDRTYRAFADLDRWPAILPDTVDVDVSYFDGYNQEFSMTVLRPEGPETVRGFRYCRFPVQLELVHTTPPPVMSRMSGLWDFTERQDGTTTVTATRQFALKPAGEGGPAVAEEQFALGLSSILRTNLQRFKEAIESE